MKFLIMMFPSFLIGGIGISEINKWFLVLWLVFIVTYFGLIEIRTMCSHCPHYAEPGNSLKCWANYGSPKLWRYRPGPMSVWEKTIFFSGLILVFLFPFVLFMIYTKWIFVILQGVAILGAFLSLRRSMCSRCMNFACPLNVVDETIQEGFFARNPRIAEAWQNE
ncbi:MAG: hypothetical protein J7L73_08960 [Anaerolineales bacterium]|nr:hypothetical protein [Anaerolineales bacterium]